MPTGYPKNGINKGQFKKGQNLGNTFGFKKGMISPMKGEKTGIVTSGCFKKGNKPWNTNKELPKEMKEKIGKSRKGKHYPKLSEAMKGRLVWNKDTKGLQVAWNKDLNKFIDERIKKYIRSGEKNHNWIDGRTPENHKIRNSVEMSLWRKSVFTKDNFTDQKTSIKGGYLIAHHINNYADFPELRFAIDNGITLSKQSHLDFHKKYGFKNNTREQLEEFLSTTI